MNPPSTMKLCIYALFSLKMIINTLSGILICVIAIFAPNIITLSLFMFATYLVWVEWQWISGLFLERKVTLHTYYIHSIWSHVLWICISSTLWYFLGYNLAVAIHILTNMLCVAIVHSSRESLFCNVKHFLSY